MSRHTRAQNLKAAREQAFTALLDINAAIRRIEKDPVDDFRHVYSASRFLYEAAKRSEWAANNLKALAESLEKFSPPEAPHGLDDVAWAATPETTP